MEFEFQMLILDNNANLRLNAENSQKLFSNKVQVFWEGHKNLHFDIYQVNVKTMRKIAQIFVAFSEKLNFTLLFSRSRWKQFVNQNSISNLLL